MIEILEMLSFSACEYSEHDRTVGWIFKHCDMMTAYGSARAWRLSIDRDGIR